MHGRLIMLWIVRALILGAIAAALCLSFAHHSIRVKQSLDSTDDISTIQPSEADALFFLFKTRRPSS